MSKKDKIKESATPIAVIIWIAIFIVMVSFFVDRKPAVIILLMGLLIIFLLDKVHKQNQENRKKEYMLWFVCDKSNKFGAPDWQYGESLYDVFISYNNYVNNKYPISESEEEYAKSIIKGFKDYCRTFYCNGGCFASKTNSFYDTDFFFAELFYFLKEHSYDSEFCDQIMHKNIPGKDNAFALSDFAVVYFKMLYVARLVCDKSDNFKNISPYPLIDCDYQKIIESKTLPSFATL